MFRLTLDLFGTRSPERRWPKSLFIGDAAMGPSLEILWHSDQPPLCSLCGERSAVTIQSYDDGGSDGYYCKPCNDLL